MHCLCVCVCCGTAQCRSSFMRVNGIVYWLTVNVLSPQHPFPEMGVALTVCCSCCCCCLQHAMRCDGASSVGRDGLHFSPMSWALPIFSEFSHYPKQSPHFVRTFQASLFFFCFFFPPEYPIQHHYLYRLPIPIAPRAVRGIERVYLFVMESRCRGNYNDIKATH